MMSDLTKNPEISPLLRRLTQIEVVVLFITGPLLFFFPDALLALWPWQMLPFNTVFLASVYSASLVATGLMVWSNRWSPARIVVPMIGVFTLIVLIFSIWYIDVFDTDYWGTWLWLLLYTILPINAFYHMWLYRDLGPNNITPLSRPWKVCLQIQAAGLLGYGLAMIVISATATIFWPWPLDPFAARLYSVAFLAPGIAALYMIKGADRLEWLTLGFTQAVLGILSIVGVVMIDLGIQRLNWATASTWIWVGMFALITVVAIAMIHKGRQMPPN